jgi:hypothetical protein
MTTENRSLRFMGTAFGTNVTLNIELNGNTIYNGIVPSVDAPIVQMPVADDYQYTVLAETAALADIHTDFAGSLPMKITVTGGHGVLLQDIQSNYQKDHEEMCRIRFGDCGNVGTPSWHEFENAYVGYPPNSDGTPDVRSNVAIDGVHQPFLSKGICHWIVPAGSNITCNFNISLGQVAYPDSSRPYLP